MKAQTYTKDLLRRISLLHAKVVFVVHQGDEQNFRSLMEIAPSLLEHLRSNHTPPACCVYFDSPETVNPLIDPMDLKNLNISFFGLSFDILNQKSYRNYFIYLDPEEINE